MPDDYFDEGDAATPGDAAPQNTCSCGKPAIAGQSFCSECLGEEVKTCAEEVKTCAVELIRVLCWALVIYAFFYVRESEQRELLLYLAFIIYAFSDVFTESLGDESPHPLGVG